MIMDRVAWEKTKAEFRLYKWPLVINLGLQVFSLILSFNRIWPLLSPYIPLVSMLILFPWIFVDGRRRRKEADRQKLELQEKYDAEDKAMFGKPLREFKL